MWGAILCPRSSFLHGGGLPFYTSKGGPVFRGKVKGSNVKDDLSDCILVKDHALGNTARLQCRVL